MLTRYPSATLLSRAVPLVLGGWLAVSTALAQSPSPQSPSGQSESGASAQTSGQGSVAVGRSGAAAQGSGSSEGAGHFGDRSAQLATDSTVNAVLTKPVDSGKAKPGDPVSARTTQPARTSDGTSIPEGSTLVGHVTEARARGEGQASSAVGIAFDKAVTKDGREIPLRNVGIRALAAAQGAGAASAGDNEMMMGASGIGGGMAAGRGGGGLIGRTTGSVGGGLGGGLGAAGGAVGSLGGSTSGALQAGQGAIGGLDASGLLTAGSSGVFGLRDMGLASAASGTAQGSLITSTGKRIRLDQGTRMLLSSQAGASGDSDRKSNAAKPSGPKGSEPDRR